MNQPSNRLTIRLGNETEPSIANQTKSPSPTLLEQARARNNDRFVRQDSIHHIERNNPINTSVFRAEKTERRKFVSHFTSKGKRAGLAAVFGGLIGVLLGLGAYYLFSGSTSTDNSKAIGMSPTNMSPFSTGTNGTTRSDSQISGTNGSISPGTQVYLYQIGLFRTSEAANQQAQILKGKGIPTFLHGNGPYQLLAGAAPTKSGFDNVNQRLQEAGVEYYMKPFMIPGVPGAITQVSEQNATAIRDALQEEWKLVEAINQNRSNQSQSNQSVEKVVQDVRNSFQRLPSAFSQAVHDIDASLTDVQNLNDSKAETQSYWLGKFYLDYAQGITDLTIKP
jgi:hypothetical protein